MKNTKNLLITGVVLAIALFASVQVNAMKPSREVNPNLTERQKEKLQNWMEELAENIKNSGHCDPKNKMMHLCKYSTEQLSAFKIIYYGNKPYTWEQMNNVHDNFWRVNVDDL